jgi:hypothetical protein
MTVYKVPYWDVKHEDGNYFHVIAHGFANALGEAANYLDNEVGEGNWEILEIEMKPGIRIVNSWLEDNGDEEEEHDPVNHIGDVSCPYCTYEDSTKENKMIIICPKCFQELKVSNNGWRSIFCLSCREKIDREDVYKSEDGKWLFKNKEKVKE